MKNRLTKFFTVFLAVVLCIGMAPATGSTAYAASRWGGSSISSWWNSWFGGSNSGSNNNNSSSNSNQAGENDATSSNSSTVDLDELDGSGSSDGQLSLTKSITHKGGDNYTIRLEAYATGEVKNTTVTKDVPTDIVLVLDQSGSMKEKMITTRYEEVYSSDKDFSTNNTYYIKTDSGWQSVSYIKRYIFFGNKGWRTAYFTSEITPKTNASDTSPNTVQFYKRIVDNSSETRLQALQAAVNSFITNVKNKANGKEDLYRVAIVGFASGQKYNGTNYNYGNTEVFVGSNQYTYNAGSSNNASNTNSAQSHYKDALQDVGKTTGYDNLIASKDSLSADGGTIANLGMEMAKGILNNSPTDHNKAIVMFTDGQPGWSGFDENVANSTIKESYNSKSKGTSVYTVGVFGGDDLTTDVQTYMSRTSSNYPTAQNMTDELKEESTDYYMTADNAADLNNIFKQISENIQTGSTSVPLDSNSVLRDVISDDFSLTNGENTNIVVKTADYQGGEFNDASSWKTPESFKDAQVNITGKTINVSNFNYKDLYVTSLNNKPQGKKLIVEIPVTINRSFGANNVLSNASAGIYTATDATDAFITVESPEGSHPTEYGVKGTEQWIDPDNSVTIKSLIDYAVGEDGFEYTPDGTNNKYVDIVYTITDKDGNEVGTYTIEHGKTEGTASPANTPKLNVDTVYTVTAKVTPIADATDADKACGRQAEEKTYTTESYVYIKGVTTAFVIDFDKPVKYTKEQVFTPNQLSTEQKINAISYKSGSNTYGTLTLNNDKSITYKLKTFMDGIDTYVFDVANKCTQTVKMMPATSVYYDDSFTAKDGNGIVDGITYTGNWQVAEKEDIGYQDSTQGENANYGYDSSEELIGNSNGTVHFIDGTNTVSQTASLTFKGKGIDIYGKVDNTTGKIAARLYKDGTLVDSRVITTTYQSGTLYQVPTITFKDLEYGQYTVKITIPKGQIFYLDGLRIYNPTQDKDAQDKYTKDKENDATVVYLRDVLAGTNKKGLVTKAKGTVFIDEYLTKDAATKKQSVVKAHNLDVDSSDISQEYIKYGCKQAETNIPAGASMKITLDDSYSNVQIGLKTSSEGAEYKINSGSAIPLRSSTDMYYKVTLNSDNTFTITNCSKVMIQITSIKAIK